MDFSPWPRLIVELGMGDGRMLESLAKLDKNSLYIGIELDEELCREAQSRIALANVSIMNGSFENIVPAFRDWSVDRFIAVLPDPRYIDEEKEDSWKPFYKTVHAKLKKNGTLELVTEITDRLLQPVSDKQYEEWAGRLKSIMFSIGFKLKSQLEGAPAQYSSRCLDQFSGDPVRIRMATLEFAKQ